MKYIRRYLTTNSYNEDKSNIQNLDFAVSQDVESDKVYLHLDRIVSPSESSPCDICLYDKTADKLIIVKNDLWRIKYYPADKYTPVGIVVVPGTHNVYGDGSCGVMSLKEMDCNTPDSGNTSYQSICWGGAGDDISSHDLKLVPTGNTSNGIPTDINSSGYLPSDKFSDSRCAHDTDAYYNAPPYIPSPYLTDGNRNPGYYQTTLPSSPDNVLADFNGIGNNQALLNLATSQSDWKTASSITNSNNSNYYPAVFCCWRYHTEGTDQGDWYLPACGELGYIMPTFNKINDTIGKMRTAYGLSAGVVLSISNNYWSSTERNITDGNRVHTGSGGVFAYAKSSNACVRAFLRVS